MITPTLILDCNNLCHRYFHAFGSTLHDIKYPVTYGLLRNLHTFSKILDTNKFVFCFDGGDYARRDIYPEYKAKSIPSPNRGKLNEEIELLRKDVLPSLGYKNIFCTYKYEADDLIAYICDARRIEDQYIIVSTDTDLYQLLEDKNRVTIWNQAKKCSITAPYVKEEYGIPPSQWALYKAIVGDKADNIDGVPGVGVMLASKFLQLKATTAISEKIEEYAALVRRNKALITLPYCGLPKLHLPILKDSIYKERWDDIVEQFELPKLLGKCPIGV